MDTIEDSKILVGGGTYKRLKIVTGIFVTVFLGVFYDTIIYLLDIHLPPSISHLPEL
jgi:hypothetical protein